MLWMNTVGPYHNRQETYSYFSLPFCAGPKESISHYHETLGEALQGTELEFSGLDIDFKSRFSLRLLVVCMIKLNFLGPVVQNFVSLTLSLSPQFVNYLSTSKANTLLVFVDKM